MVRSGLFRLLFFAAVCAAAALAQYTNATISGVVYDPGGAVVEGANVTIRNAETGYSKTVQTGADGAFLFPATPVGSYQLIVEKPGFA
ncbi:MAG TPA: carboxypeptidase-like regulatory domain-containing protein, partial [Bryobacteraceae bacterium]|nr:carboxypeptidase-like regulatory domain-containing protein [Bryobacteraceae bacterium]